MAGRKRERYKIEPRISVPFMLELEYESKIICKKLLVIIEIRSWLPPGWRDRTFAAKKLQVVLNSIKLVTCNCR